MAHHKRRKRRKGGIKGHCWMCCLRTTDGRRNGRLLSIQEARARYSEYEQLNSDNAAKPRARHDKYEYLTDPKQLSKVKVRVY